LHRTVRIYAAADIFGVCAFSVKLAAEN